MNKLDVLSREPSLENKDKSQYPKDIKVEHQKKCVGKTDIIIPSGYSFPKDWFF
jgi:hypothetical protein